MYVTLTRPQLSQTERLIPATSIRISLLWEHFSMLRRLDRKFLLMKFYIVGRMWVTGGSLPSRTR